MVDTMTRYLSFVSVIFNDDVIMILNANSKTINGTNNEHTKIISQLNFTTTSYDEKLIQFNK